MDFAGYADAVLERNQDDETARQREARCDTHAFFTDRLAGDLDENILVALDIDFAVLLLHPAAVALGAVIAPVLALLRLRRGGSGGGGGDALDYPRACLS